MIQLRSREFWTLISIVLRLRDDLIGGWLPAPPKAKKTGNTESRKVPSQKAHHPQTSPFQTPRPKSLRPVQPCNGSTHPPYSEASRVASTGPGMVVPVRAAAWKPWRRGAKSWALAVRAADGSPFTRTTSRTRCSTRSRRRIFLDLVGPSNRFCIYPSSFGCWEGFWFGSWKMMEQCEYTPKLALAAAKVVCRLLRTINPPIGIGHALRKGGFMVLKSLH